MTSLLPDGHVPVPLAAIMADIPPIARKIHLRLCALCWNGVKFVQSDPMTKGEISALCFVTRNRLLEAMRTLERFNLAKLVPVMAGALFAVVIPDDRNPVADGIVLASGMGEQSDSASRDRNPVADGIVLSSDVAGKADHAPKVGGGDRNPVAQSFYIPSSYQRLLQIQEHKTLDDRNPVADGIVWSDERWAKFGALMAVGVFQNIATEISALEDLTLKAVLSHIRAWQNEGKKTGVGMLVGRLRAGQPAPDVCPECGQSRSADHNPLCQTCAEFAQGEYARWATPDDDEEET